MNSVHRIHLLHDGAKMSPPHLYTFLIKMRFENLGNSVKNKVGALDSKFQITGIFSAEPPMGKFMTERIV